MARRVAPARETEVTDARAQSIQTEAWLARNGVQFSPAMMIPLSVIDEKRSRGNQARRDPIVPESVERFATAMKRGDPFPPIVGILQAGKFVIIDGNNRQEAAKKAKLVEILAIMIAADTPSEIIQLLTVEANASHGKTPDQEWRLRQAFSLVANGLPDARAAEAAGITVNTLQKGRAVQAADERARNLRVTNFAQLVETSKVVLQAIKDDSVFYQAAKTAVDTEMKIEDVRHMCRLIKEQRSEGARIEIIGQIATERGIEQAQQKALGKVVRKKNQPKLSLVTGIGQIMAVDAAAMTRQILTTNDWQMTNAKVNEAMEKLLDIQVALEAMKDKVGDE
jgi:ParB-like chromosome segregation protein Spo0J